MTQEPWEHRMGREVLAWHWLSLEQATFLHLPAASPSLAQMRPAGAKQPGWEEQGAPLSPGGRCRGAGQEEGGP